MCPAAPVKKPEPKVEEKGPKKRVKKDKDAPKKPIPPFFCYQKARRDKLKEENPSAGNTVLIKVSWLKSSEMACEASLARGWARRGRSSAPRGK